MKGNNTIRLNQQTMQAVCKLWIDATFAPEVAATLEVAKVEASEGNEEFTVTLEAKEGPTEG